MTQGRIRQHIVSAIMSGVYKDGEILPSSRELSAFFGAHCQTIAKVYAKLIGEGVVMKQKGSAMTVAVGGTEQLRRLERIRIKDAVRELIKDALDTGLTSKEVAILFEAETDAASAAKSKSQEMGRKVRAMS